MNNTKSQNGNLYPLTLLVKKNKKNSEKSGLTSEREEAGGGWAWLLPWRPQTGEAMEAFCWIKSTKSILFACKTYLFPQIRNEKGRKSITKGRK